MFWFSRDILQYAEITTQAWHSTWNIHLNHYAKVIPVTDLHMPTVRMEGISSSPGRNVGAKALSSLWLSWELLLLLFWFYTFCETELCHIRTSPPAGLTSRGTPYLLVIILVKAVSITWWLTGTAIYLKKLTLQSLLYGNKFAFMALDAHSCISSLSSSPMPISSELLSLWRFVHHSGRLYLFMTVLSVFLVSWWACEHLERCLPVPAAPHFQAQHRFQPHEVNVSSCTKMNRVIMLLGKNRREKSCKLH